MPFATGFFRNGVTICDEDNLNKTLLGWGLFSEFPVASADNKGSIALATDRGTVYYSDGAAWIPTAIVPPGSLVQGDIVYYNGTTWVRLPPGTAGQVLTTNGAGANPAWAVVAGGFGATQSQPSRNLGTIYQNSSGKVVIVTVVVNLFINTSGNASYTPYCSAASSATTSLGQHLLGGIPGNTTTSCTFTVPPGWYYRVVSSTTGSGNTVTLNQWTEWTLG